MTSDVLLERALELTKYQAAHIQRLEVELATLRASGADAPHISRPHPVVPDPPEPPESPRRMAKAPISAKGGGRPWKHDPLDDRVAALLAERGPLPRHQLAVVLGEDDAAIERATHRMKFAGRIVCHGTRRAARWSLAGGALDRAPAADPEEDSRNPTADDAGEPRGAAIGPIAPVDGGR